MANICGVLVIVVGVRSFIADIFNDSARNRLFGLLSSETDDASKTAYWTDSRFRKRFLAHEGVIVLNKLEDEIVRERSRVETGERR